MIIDSHIHFNPEILPLERMLAGMDENGIDKAALITTLVEPFYLETRAKRWGEDLLRFALLRLNSLGQVFYANLVDKKGNFALLGKKYRVFEHPDNAPVAEVIEKHPDRFMGWIFINPAVEGSAMSEIEEWSSRDGMIGVKSHPFWHRYPISSLDPVADWCRGNGYPLLMHLGCRNGSGDYQRLPEKYPGIKVIYAHGGIPYFSKLWSYIKGKDGTYIDLSSPYLNLPLIRKVVDFLGADKCLFGTDSPYGHQAPGEDYNNGLTKGWIESLPLSDRELEKILSENFLGIIA